MEAPLCHFVMEKSDNKFEYFYENRCYMSLEFALKAKGDNTAVDDSKEASSVSGMAEGSVGFKRASDGDIQVDPPIHQLVFEPDKDCDVTIKLHPIDGLVMKPERAAEGEAILSQLGKPLIYGVNGLYDLDSDMFISWYGLESWEYEGKEITEEGLTIKGRISSDASLVMVIKQQYYRKHLGYEYHDPRKRRFNEAPICGWATWEAFHREVTAEKLRTSVDFLADKLKPYGLDYIQMDDGYQPTDMPPTAESSIYEGWTIPNEKFPKGHEDILGLIKDKGFTPAIWLNAAINNEAFADKDARFLRGKDGKLLKGPWLGYVFDCTEESCKEIEKMYRHLADLGYKYFKIDAIRHLIYDGLQLAVREGLFGNDEAIKRFRNYMQALRRGIGEDNYLLSCWGVLTPNVGIADAMRFATDASASDHSFRMQVDESAYWHHTHGVLYKNDPDYICLRMENAPARSIASLIALNGYLYFISDDVSLYTDDKLEIAQKTMPNLHAATGETGLLEAKSAMNYSRNMLKPRKAEQALSFGNIWATHFAQHGRQWAVVNLIRTAQEAEKELEIPLENLGLNPYQQYAVFDFWEQKAVGFVNGKINMKIPEYLDCSVIALSPVNNEPEFIGSSRHVSMDAVSVLDIKKGKGSITLSVKGPKGASAEYFFVYAGEFKSVKISYKGEVQEVAVQWHR